MKNYKNYLIAILSGLLMLSLSTQQAQSAGTSATAKAIQNDHCITMFSGDNKGAATFIENIFATCAKYKP